MEPTKNVGVLWRMWKWRIRERLWHSNVLDNLGEQFFPFCQYWVSILQCQRRNNHSLWLLHCPVEKISNILWLNGKVMNCLVKKNENKHEQKNQRVKVAGAGPERESGDGCGRGDGSGSRSSCTSWDCVLKNFLLITLKVNWRNELTPLAAYLKLV